MEMINGIHRWNSIDRRPLTLALGNFDGVHRGHQAIIRTAVDAARAAKGRSAALLFDPHPSMLLRPDPSFALLTDLVDRAELMAGLGLDYVIVEPFTEELAALPPERFVEDILVRKLAVSGVVVGYDYSFGRHGRGKVETMAALGEKYGFTVTICPAIRHKQKIISSSAIRSLLQKGAVAEAAALLNYYFFRHGKVIRGSGIGSKILYPTANIDIPARLIQPGQGVYLTAVAGPAAGGELLFGVTNVGAKPTFTCSRAAIETHILDFQGDLYGRTICLYFLEKLRDTRAFNSPRLLKEQISRDILQARKLIAKRYCRQVAKGCAAPGLKETGVKG